MQLRTGEATQKLQLQEVRKVQGQGAGRGCAGRCSRRRFVVLVVILGLFFCQSPNVVPGKELLGDDQAQARDVLQGLQGRDQLYLLPLAVCGERERSGPRYRGQVWRFLPQSLRHVRHGNMQEENHCLRCNSWPSQSQTMRRLSPPKGTAPGKEEDAREEKEREPQRLRVRIAIRSSSLHTLHTPHIQLFSCYCCDLTHTLVPLPNCTHTSRGENRKLERDRAKTATKIQKGMKE